MTDITATKPYHSNLLLKTILFWLVFLGLTALHKAYPYFPVIIISGINESNFQHYKTGFFAYLITSAIEYLIFRKRIADKQAFLDARLTSSLFLPWVIFLIWYIAAATVGKLPIPLEIAWANTAVVLVGVCVVTLERSWETVRITRASRFVIRALILLSVFLYMRFTFGELPWADVFVEPDWR